jgi:signal transduction histidine kinase
VVAPRLLAATAEVARGDVLAGVYAHGHRVKNVLGIIGSRTRSARKLAGDGELSEKLEALEREVTALYEEWAQYLRSMQAAGPTLEVVAVTPLVHDIVAAAGAKSTTPIELNVASNLPDLRGDRMLLREALLNIVSNACEACASTGGAVTITARPVAAGGAPAIEVVVTDTGPGISKAELVRIFVPGYTTKETGSGVGLAIAERVVAAHHGRIMIDSEEGKGTTVTVIVPTDLGGFATLGTLAPRAEGAV